MRFNILLSLTFLATFASGLVIPGSDSSDIEARDAFDLESEVELVARDGLVDDAVDHFISKREPRTSNAKKTRIAAAKPAKAAAKAAKKSSFAGAAKAHKATTGLPNRKSKFHVPAGGGKPAQTYTGKDVRKAVFNSHMEAHKNKNASKRQQKKSDLKQFSNHPHQTPKGLGGKHVRPIPNMKVDHVNKPPKAGRGKGREYPLPNKANPGASSPARVITQQTKKGHHTFKGVIAHDQSRTSSEPGYNDHFKVKESKPRKKT